MSLSLTRRPAILEMRLVILLLLTCCGSCVYAAGSISYYTAKQQQHTLRLLQSFTQAMPGLTTNWTGRNFCNWDSVTCTADGVSVGVSNWALLATTGGSLPELARGVDGSQVVITTLSLGSNGLTGTLPASWARLASMKSIDLSGNSITGTIPAEWSELSSLSTLTLTSNQLCGTLPSTWSDMPALYYLAADSNQLSGTLPSRWSAMQSLRMLDLKNNLFTGSIPKSWANITSLMTLSLQRNGFCGCKPDGLTTNFYADAALTSTTCAVANACLASDSSDAKCDADVTNLSDDEQVTNTRNFLLTFATAIPALATRWTCPNFCTWNYIACTNKAVEVIMPSDSLVGTLPDVPADVDPSKVAVSLIDLSCNSAIAGTLPASWGGLTALKLLSVRYTGVAGTLPASWSGMRSLEKLFIQNTAVSGTLPASWGALPSLHTLYLNNNNLNGTLPIAWGTLSTLAYLRLDSNQLDGFIPTAWNDMSIITRVALGGNAFCGCMPSEWIAVPVEVSAAADLVSADCGTINVYKSTVNSNTARSFLSSSFPAAFVGECNDNVPYYTAEEKKHTRNFLKLLSDSILGLSDKWSCNNFCSWEFISCFPGHVELRMSNSGIFGTLPPLASDVDPTQVVVTNMDFASNWDFNGLLPPSWSTLTRVTHLNLSDTLVSGSLPSLLAMSSLQFFDASRTLLFGPIPADWGNLSNLQTLRLQNLDISKSILPSSWASMTSLIELDVSSTGIRGVLPSSWGNLKNLSTLILNHNELFGTLPDEWKGMTNLYRLQVNNNHFSGSIPASYGSLPTLKYVSLQANDFCGCLPTEWKASNVTYTADLPMIASNCSTANSCTPTVVSSFSFSSSSSSSNVSGSSADECNADVPFLTVAQTNATRSLLNVIKDAFAEQLNPLWTCPNLCAWCNISCTEDGVYLNLRGYGLRGSMPCVPSVAHLNDIMVRSIDLSENIGINGSLCSTWLTLPHLRYFNTGGCSLSGNLPD